VRVPFFEEVAQALAAQPLLGDGLIHRCIAETQRRFFTPSEEAAGLKGAPRHRGSKHA
jgi:hypothetical protein